MDDYEASRHNHIPLMNQSFSPSLKKASTRGYMVQVSGYKRNLKAKQKKGTQIIIRFITNEISKSFDHNCCRNPL